ncbi:unnamed protein product [Calicophoron daubneyi]|uniref:Coiled-coil domain-containing protein 149 n=1 Tax=Calicophoron daubneyi TaxID=300641 RepID=A0AAV2T2I7_CALDB
MIDERLVAEIDVLKTDLAVVSKKLDSKSQAVIILHEALEKCKGERDEFKRMAEQVMSRYQLLRKTLSQGTQSDGFSAKGLSQLSSQHLASLLVESREANRGLQQEIAELKTKLGEATGDIKVLRQQLRENTVNNNHKGTSLNKQELVYHMEKLTVQIQELQSELARCSDEKQELAAERDIYRNKCDRLNNELNYILNGDERKLIDVDALINEKKTLTNRLQTVEEEKRHAMTTLSKYKKILENKLCKASSVSSDVFLTPRSSPLCKGQSSLIGRSKSYSDSAEDAAVPYTSESNSVICSTFQNEPPDQSASTKDDKSPKALAEVALNSSQTAATPEDLNEHKPV